MSNGAPKHMIKMAIRAARKTDKSIVLCGRYLLAPLSFLVEERIGNISFNPDALLQGIDSIIKAEKA